MSGTTGTYLQRIGSINQADQSTESWSDGQWWQQLQPGSWRGVGFVMDVLGNRAGRRTVVHEYPYRDDVWVEDLGKLPRRFGLQAFLTGDDVYQQRDAMLRASEQPGAGTLVHPTLGTMQCVLVDFGWRDGRDRGRYIELNMAFVLAGDLLYPTTAAATGQQVQDASANLNAASAAATSSAIQNGPQSIELAATSTVPAAIIPNGAGSHVGQFCDLAEQAASDAARPIAAVRGLQGFYGRYASGGLSVVQPASATVASLLAGATAQRTAVLQASALVRQLASMI